MEEALIKRIMPNSLEAEQSVVGSMIMSKDAIVTASEMLLKEDFYHQQYGIIFETMVELFTEGQPVDLVTLQNQHADKVAQENYESALALAKVVENTKVVVKLRSGEGGRTFGSISTKEISAAAKERHGLELDKKKMQLNESIKALGNYEVPVKLHPKVTANLTVSVVEG